MEKRAHVTKMIELGTALTVLRHRTLLISESINAGEGVVKQKQGQLDHLQSTIGNLEIALEFERRTQVAASAPAAHR